MFRNRNRYKSKKYRRVVLNHIQHNHCLVTKSGLYLSIKEYCSIAGIDLGTIIPHTFYLSSLMKNEDRNIELEEFIDHNNNESDDIIWILKPAYASNQGFGIKVVHGMNECLEVIGCQNRSPRQEILKEGDENVCQDEEMLIEESEHLSATSKKTPKITEWIVQRYMRDPLLVRGRKFDIRCFVLLVMKQTSHSKVLEDGSREDCVLKAYLYQDGYIRTSGKKYNLKNLNDKEIHLTNDSVQKKAASYGKYESGNKLSYDQFQSVISRDYPQSPPGVVRSKILPQIEYQVRNCVFSTLILMSLI